VELRFDVKEIYEIKVVKIGNGFIIHLFAKDWYNIYYFKTWKEIKDYFGKIEIDEG